jgi:hypothetical protein
MLEISDDKFLDEDYDVTVGDGAIVLTSWSDGHNHLYLYSYDKRSRPRPMRSWKSQLTQGDFEVGDVYNVDTRAQSGGPTHRTKAIRWSSRSGRSTSTASASS